MATGERGVALADIRGLTREALVEFVDASLVRASEDQAVAVLQNRFCDARICQAIAMNERLAAYASVRIALVANRATPQAHAMKLVHYISWRDLLRLSVDVRVPSPVRRAVDNQLISRLRKLTVGEKISSARVCSRDLVRAVLLDAHPRVFDAALTNPRLVEDDLIRLLAGDVTPHQIERIARDRKWGCRYAIRMSIVQHAATPRAVAALQLPHLRPSDRDKLLGNPDLSTYLRRCIERLSSHAKAASENSQTADLRRFR